MSAEGWDTENFIFHWQQNTKHESWESFVKAMEKVAPHDKIDSSSSFDVYLAKKLRLLSRQLDKLGFECPSDIAKKIPAKSKPTLTDIGEVLGLKKK
tara:strand:- start:123 stop:413 length:291 start_codon:yes stop_codon:yes gene_type:complete